MDDPRQQSVAYVQKDGRLAGTLTRTDRGTEFTYRREYLDGPSVPIATTLPLTDEPVVRPGRSVPAYFAALLPEGRRLTALRQSIKASADDELSLLLVAGADPVGDVAVTPTPDLADVTLEEPMDGSWKDVRFADLMADQIDPSALAGVQDKVSGRMITVPLVRDGRTYLLKLTPPEFPRLVDNESFFLRHAARLPIPVVESEVVADRTGAAGLLVTRFDRVCAGDAVRCLPVEDGTQLLDLFPGDKYSLTTERLAEAVAAACASQPLALRSVFIQVTWAWLSGNGDLHGKNISVVGRDPTDGGTHAVEGVVAPMYDIPSTVPYGDHTLALPLDGRREGITRRRLLVFAANAGLPERAAIAALDETAAVAADMLDDIRAGGSPWRGKKRDDLARVLEYRLEQLSVRS